MDFKTGDYVRFVNERQEGTVTRLFSDGLIGVTIEEDFEIPVAPTEIVLIEKAGSRSLPVDTPGGALQSQEPGTGAAIANGKKPADLKNRGLSLAFTEDKALKYILHRHIINGTDYQLFILIYFDKKGTFTLDWSGYADPGLATTIPPVSLKEAESWPISNFQCLYLRRGVYFPVVPLVRSLKLRSMHFTVTRKSIQFVNDPGWEFSLDPTLPDIDPLQLREHILSKNHVVAQGLRPEPSQEVDLHLESLPGYTRNALPKDVLKQQLDHFQNNLDLALAAGMEKIVFIHGVGNGVLRQEIHKRISANPYVRTWKDAGKDKFGYGATEVFLK